MEQTFLQFLFSSYVSVFTYVGGAGVLLIIVYMISATLGLDHDVSTDHDIGHDHDHDHDHGHHHGEYFHHDGEHGEHEHWLVTAMSWFGIGRVPIMIVMSVALLSFSIIGIIACKILQVVLPAWAGFLPACIAALFGTSIILNLTSRILGDKIKKIETYIEKPGAFVGRSGQVTIKVDDQFGEVSATENTGASTILTAKVKSGEKPIPIGTKVKMTKYVPTETAGYYLVEIDKS